MICISIIREDDVTSPISSKRKFVVRAISIVKMINNGQTETQNVECPLHMQ